MILQLREAIVKGQWEQVKAIVENALEGQTQTQMRGTARLSRSGAQGTVLPPSAVEELSAVKEGLVYQDCMVRPQ